VCVLSAWLMVAGTGCGKPDLAQDARHAISDALAEAAIRTGIAPTNVIYLAPEYDSFAEEQAKRLEDILSTRGFSATWNVLRLPSDPMKAQIGESESGSNELRLALSDTDAQTLVLFSEWMPALFSSVPSKKTFMIVGFVPNNETAAQLLEAGRINAAVTPHSAPPSSAKLPLWQRLYEISP